MPPPSDSSGSSSKRSIPSTSGTNATTADGLLTVGELWALLRPDASRLLLCLAFTILSVASYVCVAPSLGAVIDAISQIQSSQGAPGLPSTLARRLGLLGAAYLGTTVGLAVQVRLALALGEAMAMRLRQRLFSALLRRETLFFEQTKTGQLMQWLGSDIETLQSTVANLLGARGLRSALETVGIVTVLLLLNPSLACVLLFTAPLLAPLIQSLSERIRGASSAAAAAAAEASAAADEIVENSKVVRVFGQAAREQARYEGLTAAAHAAALRGVRMSAALDFSSRARNTLCILATLILGTYMACAGRTTPGTLYTFFVNSFSIALSLGNLTATAADLAKAAGQVGRVLRTLREVEHAPEAAATPAGVAQQRQQQQQQQQQLPEQDATSSAHVAGQREQQQQQCVAQRGEAAAAGPSGHGLAPPPDFLGSVQFRNVSFRHPGWTCWTLQDISFTIPAGQTVALVGPSGGGKSTLASLLMGLYEPSEGDICVDGQPLSQLDLDWWRRQLGVVAQDPGLMTGRVADIIRYGRPEASQAEVEAAARAAEAHDFIAALPQGYATLVGAGEGGVELSGGQCQRLAIARALLPEPRVLVLDEATSALDVETERRVAAALAAASARGVTTLVIAHRLSTVRRADRVVVIASGRVVEQGTHEELVAREGMYARLVRKAQRRGRDTWDVPPSSDGSSSESEESAAPRGQAAVVPRQAELSAAVAGRS